MLVAFSVIFGYFSYVLSPKSFPHFPFSHMDLVLFGIQGSGKGTQAKRLVSNYGYSLFEAGGELRTIAASGSDLGNTVKSFIDVGKLVPFDIIMEVVKTAILSRPATQKILFDGIPRDTDQMHSFDQIMREAKRDFRCIEIELTAEEGVQRILGRAKVEGRADDANEETIRRRMQTFFDKTKPVIAQYEAQGKLIRVDGKGAVDGVYAEIVRVLGL